MTVREAATTVASDARQWHALGADEVQSILGTGPNGISHDEAGRRLDEYGPNRIEEEKATRAFVVFLKQFRSPLIYILLIAAFATVLLREYIDSAVIAAVLLLNAVIGFTQERQAERSIQALKQLVSPRAHVIRNGRETELESADLVPGDLVLLESGARVPADIRIVAATALMIDESLLTGESVPVQKRPPAIDPDTPTADRTNTAFAGTTVTSGRGRGIVVETGPNTALGQIAEEIREHEEAQTPLQARMNRFAGIVGVAVLGSTLVAFALGIARGLSVSEMFLVGVGLAVAAVPEGLPVVFTITLAIGVHRMARRNAIIRSLPAVETLGSTTVIGSDKTGTLTENRMTVERIWTPDGLYRVALGDAEGDDPETYDLNEVTLDEHCALNMALQTGVLTNEADVDVEDDGYAIHGDPTEAALLVAAIRAGLDLSELRAAHEVIAETPFEPDLQYSASLRRSLDGEVLYVKGAPERVLGMCETMLVERQVRPVDHETVSQAAADMAHSGLRVLAVAYRDAPDIPDSHEHMPEPSGLTLVGLQGMLDPARAGVHEAIAGCQRAGIRVMMITGDHAATARSIGRQLGIAGQDDSVLSGRELDRLSDAELDYAVERVAIFARVSPSHKLRVVQALQRHGHVVGVTGDGVNDAPALKAADIGIAMGKSGTDVAREASDMVLADDNFVSIYGAVEQGRITFDNVRKVTFFLLSTGVAAVVTILSALAFGWPLPFVPAQLLWLNLVTNGLQDVALAFEPGERDVLDRPPRKREEGIVSRLLWERTALAGLVMAVGTLFMFWWELEQGSSLIQAQTVALTTMVIFQMFHVGNARSDYRSAFTVNPLANPFLLIATGAAFAIHVLALHVAPTQFVLRVEPISLETWTRIITVALSVIVAVEIHKLIRRPPGARSQPSRPA
jgi:magnesium-transporting ATPase (P-type)